jgi:hypothetical protein
LHQSTNRKKPDSTSGTSQIPERSHADEGLLDLSNILVEGVNSAAETDPQIA